MYKIVPCHGCDETCSAYSFHNNALQKVAAKAAQGDEESKQELQSLIATGTAIEVDDETGKPIKRKTTLKPVLCFGCDETCDNYQAILAALPSLTKAAEEGSPRAVEQISHLKQIGKVIEVDDETGQPIRTQDRTISKFRSELETMLFALGYIRGLR